MTTNTLPGGQKVIEGAMAVTLLDQSGAAVTSLGANGIVDNAAFTEGVSQVQPAGYRYDAVAGAAMTENAVGVARMDVKRVVLSSIEDATTRGQGLTVLSTGSARVNLDAATQAAFISSGTPYSIAMQPRVFGDAVTAPNSSNLQEFNTDSNGYNKVQIFPGGFTGDTGVFLCISWSTTVNDQAAVKTAVEAGLTKLATPDGSPLQNTMLLPLKSSVGMWEIEIDPASPVKTFGMELSAAVPGIKVSVMGLRA